VAGFLAGCGILGGIAWHRKILTRPLALLWYLARTALALVPVWLLWELARVSIGPWWAAGLTWISAGLLALEGLLALALWFVGLLTLGIRPWRDFPRANTKEKKDAT
jgi:hypothetical protein